MSFGKDEQVLSGMRMNNRQAMRQSAKRPPRGSGGGGGLVFRDKWQPPTDGSIDTVRFLAGQYLAPLIDVDNKDFFYNEDGSIVQVTNTFVKFKEYYYAPTKKYIIGSEGPLGEFKGKGEPCLASDWHWYEWRERGKTTPPAKTPNTIRGSDKFVMSLLIQAPYYRVPQKDKNGAVRMNEQTKQPFMEWVKGSKRENDEYAAAKYEKKFGHVVHWAMNFMHWQYVLDFQDTLATSCRHCGGTDTIEQVALVCQHCGEAVVELASTSLSENELAKFRNEKVTCTTCHQTGYLDDVIECSACPNADQATLFDFDIDIKRVKDPQATNDNQTLLMISKAIGPRALDAKFKDDMRQPLDLPKIYTPTPMAKQLEILGALPADDEAQGQQQGVFDELFQREPVTRGSRSYGR